VRHAVSAERKGIHAISIDGVECAVRELIDRTVAEAESIMRGRLSSLLTGPVDQVPGHTTTTSPTVI
jgi:hypothetical protein